MFNIYFTASTSHNGELIAYYKRILDNIKKLNVNILSGDQVVDRQILKKDKELSAEEIYTRERYQIDQADFVIAEVSKPSLGVGAEIVYALSARKPVLALVRTNYEDRISPILLGNPSENLYLEFYRDKDIPAIISKFIKSIKALTEYKKILKRKRGKLIVIDGGDGSGKTTQVAILVDYFKKNYIPIKSVDFPQYYKSFHGKMVARFLRGEFGDIDEVSPYLASLSYALDRATIKNEMDDFLRKGGYIVANRYATSSMAHHGAKFSNKKERDEFLKWIMELEYKEHKIPKEDIVIYLYVPWKIGIELTQKKEKREYLKDQAQDIHEKNLQYRKSVEKMYILLAKRYPHWVTINCIKDNKILSPDKIHQKILEVLKNNKIID